MDGPNSVFIENSGAIENYCQISGAPTGGWDGHWGLPVLAKYIPNENKNNQISK